MPIGFIFWLMMLIWLLFGLWNSWPNARGWAEGSLFQFILFFLLGWKIFGFMVHS